MVIQRFSKWQPSAILDFINLQFLSRSLCQHAVLVQKFAEIAQSVDELRSKERFSRWRLSPSWILKISISGHVTVMEFSICCSVPKFSKIGWFYTEMWRYKYLKNVGRLPCWISKVCSFCYVALSTCRFASWYKISLKSDNRLMSYGQKSDFQVGGCRHLEFFFKFQFLLTLLSSGSVSAVVYQISSKLDDFCTEIWWFNDFQNGGRPPCWITGSAVALHCVKAHRQSQWRSPNFYPL